MYEKIISYLDFFDNGTLSEPELNEKINLFSADFMQSEFMNPNAIEAMGDRMWLSKTELKNQALSMTAEDACICLSAFIQQESFIPGILLDLIQQGVIPQILKRLKELDS